MTEVDILQLASYAGSIGVTFAAAYGYFRTKLSKIRTIADEYLTARSVTKRMIDDLDDALHDDKVTDTEFIQLFHDAKAVITGAKTAISTKTLEPLL